MAVQVLLFGLARGAGAMTARGAGAMTARGAGTTTARGLIRTATYANRLLGDGGDGGDGGFGGGGMIGGGGRFGKNKNDLDTISGKLNFVISSLNNMKAMSMPHGGGAHTALTNTNPLSGLMNKSSFGKNKNDLDTISDKLNFAISSLNNLTTLNYRILSKLDIFTDDFAVKMDEMRENKGLQDVRMQGDGDDTAGNEKKSGLDSIAETVKNAGLGIDGIDAMIGILLFTYWPDIVEGFEAVGKGFEEMGQGMVEFIMEDIPDAAEAIAGAAEDVAEGIVNAAEGAAEGIANAAEGAWNWFTGWFTDEEAEAEEEAKKRQEEFAKQELERNIQLYKGMDQAQVDYEKYAKAQDDLRNAAMEHMASKEMTEPDDPGLIGARSGHMQSIEIRKKQVPMHFGLDMGMAGIKEFETRLGKVYVDDKEVPSGAGGFQLTTIAGRAVTQGEELTPSQMFDLGVLLRDHPEYAKYYAPWIMAQYYKQATGGKDLAGVTKTTSTAAAVKFAEPDRNIYDEVSAPGREKETPPIISPALGGRASVGLNKMDKMNKYADAIASDSKNRSWQAAQALSVTEGTRFGSLSTVSDIDTLRLEALGQAYMSDYEAENILQEIVDQYESGKEPTETALQRWIELNPGGKLGGIDIAEAVALGITATRNDQTGKEKWFNLPEQVKLLDELVAYPAGSAGREEIINTILWPKLKEIMLSAARNALYDDYQLLKTGQLPSQSRSYVGPNFYTLDRSMPGSNFGQGMMPISLMSDEALQKIFGKGLAETRERAAPPIPMGQTPGTPSTKFGMGLAYDGLDLYKGMNDKTAEALSIYDNLYKGMNDKTAAAMTFSKVPEIPKVLGMGSSMSPDQNISTTESPSPRPWASISQKDIDDFRRRLTGKSEYSTKHQYRKVGLRDSPLASDEEIAHLLYAYGKTGGAGKAKFTMIDYRPVLEDEPLTKGQMDIIRAEGPHKYPSWIEKKYYEQEQPKLKDELPESSVEPPTTVPETPILGMNISIPSAGLPTTTPSSPAETVMKETPALETPPPKKDSEEIRALVGQEDIDEFRSRLEGKEAFIAFLANRGFTTKWPPEGNFKQMFEERRQMRYEAHGFQNEMATDDDLALWLYADRKTGGLGEKDSKTRKNWTAGVDIQKNFSMLAGQPVLEDLPLTEQQMSMISGFGKNMALSPSTEKKYYEQKEQEEKIKIESQEGRAITLPTVTDGSMYTQPPQTPANLDAQNKAMMDLTQMIATLKDMVVAGGGAPPATIVNNNNNITNVSKNVMPVGVNPRPLDPAIGSVPGGVFVSKSISKSVRDAL